MATHLDEDLCTAGGLIATVAARGAAIDVLAVTDSDGTLSGIAGGASPGELARRLARQRTAYERLGAVRARCDALALPGGRVSDHREDVVAALSEIVGFAPERSGVWVLAPWRHDAHPDHAAAGEAAALVCRAYAARLVEYPIAGCAGHVPGWRPTRALAVGPPLHSRKHHAVAATLGIVACARFPHLETYLVAADGVNGAAARAATCSRERFAATTGGG